MAAPPTRAVRLAAIGTAPDAASLAAEGVAAYKAVQMAVVLARAARLVPTRRRAAVEAATRVYAAQNFR